MQSVNGTGPDGADLDISFAIVNWKGGAVFEKCIASVREAKDGSPLRCEIVVVDNASTEEELTFLRECGEVTLIRNARNLGFARGTNQSIERCRGKYLFILNNDVILQDHDLTTIFSLMEAHKEIGVLAPRLIYPDGRLQKSISGLPTLFDVFCYSIRLSKINARFDRWKQSDFDYSSIRDAAQPMFSALFLRKEVWDQIGPLDEDFPMLFNDVDWFFRFHEKQKWRCIFYPNFVCVHYHKMSINKRIHSKIYYQVMGLYRYFVKHYQLSFSAYLFLISLCSCILCGKLVVEPLRKLAERRTGRLR
ncbi:MAG TPA: glycosyltransferase family 2 protein [Syntrophobacteria bacterium]|nr:glycosyltransferase family 2 protein [Syntrophobacteria bacterium]